MRAITVGVFALSVFVGVLSGVSFWRIVGVSYATKNRYVVLSVGGGFVRAVHVNYVLGGLKEKRRGFRFEKYPYTHAKRSSLNPYPRGSSENDTYPYIPEVQFELLAMQPRGGAGIHWGSTRSHAASWAWGAPEPPAALILRVVEFSAAYLFVPSGIFMCIVARHRARRRKRLQKGLCVTCGYDLRASEGRCPECGAEVVAGCVRLSA
jgi:hypothetical protein